MPNHATLAIGLTLALSAPAWCQTITQQGYLKANNSELGDGFGASVARSGDTVVVGTVWEASNATGVNGNGSDNHASWAGAAYVYVSNGSSWSQQAYLKASNTGPADQFGVSVAISGDTIVVGAWLEDSGASGVNGEQDDNSASSSGAAYVFVREGTSWTQQAYLKASNTGSSDTFGISLAVSGDTIIVGARGEAGDGNSAQGGGISFELGGAGYVFVRSGTTWSQQAYLKVASPQGGFGFGGSVAISGDTIVLGAANERTGGWNSGAAFVFGRSGTTWTQEAFLKASNLDNYDDFGDSVAVSDGTVVVGARGEDSAATGVNGLEGDNSLPTAGAAYVFVREGTSWSQQAYLKASNPGQDDKFGDAVAISGDMVVVGAWEEDSSGTGVNGAQNNDAAPDAGAAYLFARSGTTWSPLASLKASNAELGDQFGLAVALSGNEVLVTARGEDSSATSPGGAQGDNGAINSGAAYVFDLGIGANAWINTGGGLNGASGSPLLVGSGSLAGGSNNSAKLSNAAPSGTAALFIALASTPVPFKGGLLKPFPFFTPLILTTGPDGTISLPFVQPPGIPGDTEVWLQWAIQDAAAPEGVSLSNAIVGHTP